MVLVLSKASKLKTNEMIEVALLSSDLRGCQKPNRMTLTNVRAVIIVPKKIGTVYLPFMLSICCGLQFKSLFYTKVLAVEFCYAQHETLFAKSSTYLCMCGDKSQVMTRCSLLCLFILSRRTVAGRTGS